MEPLLVTIKGQDKVISLINDYDNIVCQHKKNVDTLIYMLLDKPDIKYEVYLELFFNNIIWKQIENISENDKLLNQFIVKSSKHKDIYDKYVKDILKMSYLEYHEKINSLIKKDSNLVDIYIDKHIHKASFENGLEMKLVDDYIARKLSSKSRLANKDIRVIVKFLIEKYSYEMGIQTKVNTVTFLENLNKEKLQLPLILKKTKSYLKVYGFCKSDPVHDGVITINTDNFRIQKFLNPYLTTKPLFDLLLTCFHELQHANQNKKTNEINGEKISLYSYKNQQEVFILKNNYKIYSKKHDCFYLEIDADAVGCKYALSILKKYSFKRYKEIEKYGLDYLNNKLIEKNMYDDNYFRTYINEMVREKPEYIKKESFLQLEYKENGFKKNILEILEQPIKELAEEDLIYYILTKSILETDPFILKGYLEMLSNDSLGIVKKAINWEQINITNKRLNINNYVNCNCITSKKDEPIHVISLKNNYKLTMYSNIIDDILTRKEITKQR